MNADETQEQTAILKVATRALAREVERLEKELSEVRAEREREIAWRDQYIEYLRRQAESAESAKHEAQASYERARAEAREAEQKWQAAAETVKRYEAEVRAGARIVETAGPHQKA